DLRRQQPEAAVFGAKLIVDCEFQRRTVHDSQILRRGLVQGNSTVTEGKPKKFNLTHWYARHNFVLLSALYFVLCRYLTKHKVQSTKICGRLRGKPANQTSHHTLDLNSFRSLDKDRLELRVGRFETNKLRLAVKLFHRCIVAIDKRNYHLSVLCSFL